MPPDAMEEPASRCVPTMDGQELGKVCSSTMWQTQSMNLGPTGPIKWVVKSQWLTGRERAEWDGQRRTALLSRATGSQTHVLFDVQTTARAEKIRNHFLLVPKDKRKYGLKKMNAVFIVSNLWIPSNKCTSPNSHKNEVRLCKWLAAGRGL